MQLLHPQAYSTKVALIQFTQHCTHIDTLQDKQEKEFIFRHSRTVFELLDEDGSHDISAEEFEGFGFLFNFHGSAVRQIFREFDVSGDQVSIGGGGGFWGEGGSM